MSSQLKDGRKFFNRGLIFCKRSRVSPAHSAISQRGMPTHRRGVVDPKKKKLNLVYMPVYLYASVRPYTSVY
jgi:hypothetical protein